MELFGETIERELPNLMRQGVRVRFVGRRDRAPESVRGRWTTSRSETSRQRPAEPLDRLRLRRSRRDRRGRAAARRGGGRPPGHRRERHRVAPLRPDMPEPDLLIRTSGELRDLELPALAARLHRARLRRHALAGLRRARSPPARSRSTRAAAGASAADERLRVAARRRRGGPAGRPRAPPATAAGGCSRSSPSPASLALDELYRAGRSFRPLVLAGFAGSPLLVGAELGGRRLDAGGVLRHAAARVLFVLFAETRQAATVSLAFTVLGVVWIGLGLAHAAPAARRSPSDGRLALFTRPARGLRDRHLRLPRRARRRAAQDGAALSPGKSWEGFFGGAVGGVFVGLDHPLPKGFADGWRSLVLGARDRLAAAIGDLVQSLVKRDLGIKDSGRLLAGHGGVSTGSTACSSPGPRRSTSSPRSVEITLVRPARVGRKGARSYSTRIR